jgi:alkylation response protein AidB-like acyl-CoA dehydrogenase
MEAFGKHLVVEPYLATVILSGGAIAALASGVERQRLLGPLIAGKTILALAHEDRGAATVAAPGAAGFILTGEKKTVLAAPMAETLLVSAALEGGGLGVFLVPVPSPRLAIRPYKMIDGHRAADVALDGVAVPRAALIGENKDAGPVIDRVVEQAIAALAADAVGAMRALVAATVEYAKTRVQFGQPIGKFQALQHRLVGMRIKEEEARASCLFATLGLAAEERLRRRAIAGAKAKIGQSARHIHQEAIQLHGAIGTTSELPVGAYAKRLIAFENLFGATREHLRRYGEMIAAPALAASGLLGDQQNM